jgi:hypothetical protein
LEIKNGDSPNNFIMPSFIVGSTANSNEQKLINHVFESVLES